MIYTVNNLHREFKKSFFTVTNKNWHSKLLSYLLKIQNFHGDAADKRMVAGWMAALCERAYYVTAHKKDAKTRSAFATRLKKLINSVSLPKFITHSSAVICGKRQPSLIETITPTFDRFDIMEQLPEVFGDGIDSIIIGGSMSYIPFFGIRENQKRKDFSDIDTLIVVNDKFFKKDSWNKFAKTNLFPASEKKTFLNRLGSFQKLLSDDVADIFSQRFSIVGKSFTISNHFLTNSAFKRMVYTDLEKSLRTKKDMQYTMRDFRLNSFRHPCHARHTFDGERFESTIDGFEIKSGGFISDMPGYIISNGKLYPGVYQTVISPAFLIFYDRTGEITKLVKRFESILYRETRIARKKFPSATYAKAHNRYDIFPPGRYDEGHDSYISSKEIRKYTPPLNTTMVSVESNILPKEIASNKMRHTEKNEDIRHKTRDLLEKWKKEVLMETEKEIRSFIKQNGNFEKAMSLAKKQGHHWHTVAAMPSTKRLTIKIPNPYKKNVSRNLVVREEIYTQIITPGEIMSLNAYEELGRKSGKVYIASIMDRVSKDNRLPISYEIVIPTP